ncbi:MAG: NAD(P)/FAD-dependent oxidoreductase [Candidatus Woesearchaeota archaeon]
MERVSVIGAGPHGNLVAWKLAEKGFNVHVYEEHKETGVPVACTGLLSDTISKHIIVPKEAINGKINKARIHSPNYYVDLKIMPNTIVDRTKYDQHFQKMAEEQGAQYHHNTKFIGIKGKNLIFSESKNNTKTNILVGADGPNSTVAKQTGLFGNRKHLVGIQARVKGKYENKIQFYPAISTYAWIVPESKNTARIGVTGTGQVRKDFEAFMGQRMKNIINYQAGPIPLHDPKINTQLITKNGPDTYLIGDAAAQIKNTTGGGLVPGLIAGNMLAESISKGRNYHKEWKKKLGRELKMHYLLRNALNRFSNEDYDTLIKTVKKPRVKQILAEESRDSPTKMLLKLAITAPDLLRFSPKVLA